MLRRSAITADYADFRRYERDRMVKTSSSSFFTDFASSRLKNYLMGIPARWRQERNFTLDKSDLKSKFEGPVAQRKMR
jgi:hypothetical protein